MPVEGRAWDCRTDTSTEVVLHEPAERGRTDAEQLHDLVGAQNATSGRTNLR